jgi:tetratricopeptide (TPR) repeat protein
VDRAGAAARRRGPGPNRTVAAPGRTGRPSAAVPDDDTLPSDVVDELAGAVGRSRAQTLARRMAAAARAYERDRYLEAMRITRVLADEVPESAAARELHGLVCYRSGRWRDAVKHLQAARSLTADDPSQIPVLMDCERAMGHRRRVEALWEELRSSSPPADVLVEGRLVLAADLAERGRLEEAITLLATAGGARNLRRPGDRHIRQWYVLADLYERAGDVPRARELFARVVTFDPEVADAADRLAALGRGSRRHGPSRKPPRAGATGRKAPEKAGPERSGPRPTGGGKATGTAR